MQSYNVIKEYQSFQSNFNTKEQTLTVLTHLEQVILNNVVGDIIEMGCHKGYLLYHIQLLLNRLNADKVLYGVDSFKGLPELSDADLSEYHYFKKGDLECEIENVYEVFNNLKKPTLLKGFFSDIDKSEYPDKVCFSHFDGDLYTSIMDSFNLIFPKLEKQSIIVVDDYTFNKTPGVKKACDEFLKDKLGYYYIENDKLIYIHSEKPLI